MFNSHTKLSPVIVDAKTIKEVDSHVYFGKKITGDGALLLEAKRILENSIASRKVPS